MSEHPEVVAAWRAGSLVVNAKILNGVNAGGIVASTTTRADMIEAIAEIKRMSAYQRAAFHSNLVSAILPETMVPAANWRPANHGSFLTDLVLLMALRFVNPSQATLFGSNLSSLGLSINPRKSLPWNKRGMFSPAEEAMINFNTTPQDNRTMTVSPDIVDIV